jgi:hypothetical protein
MSNSSFSRKNISVYLSLDDLLNTLGFSQWITYTTSFIMPCISVLGLILCSLSAFIFFHRKFKDPVFFYYRLLCLLYILHVLIGIPYGLMFSPRYFPLLDTYMSSNYLVSYIITTIFLYHLEDTLQMMILLARMRIFSPFVEKHFKFSPKAVSLSIFIVCLLINLPFAFSVKVVSFGNYLTTNGVNDTFYRYVTSDFFETPFGQILLTFTQFFLNQFLTLAVGLTLNIISVYQYKSYLRKKFQTFRRTKIAPNNPPNNVASNQVSNSGISIVPIRQEMTVKERKERKAERNMFYMALTLCSIALITRFLLMILYVYYSFFYTFEFSLIVETLLYSIQTLVPTFKIFVFYSFNRIFRQVFNQRIFQKDFTKSSS